jgi:hypothetical protein
VDGITRDRRRWLLKTREGDPLEPAGRPGKGHLGLAAEAVVADTLEVGGEEPDRNRPASAISRKDPVVAASLAY